MKQRFAAIMAGGSGERFWPLSRRTHPKQLLKLPGSDRTMLGDTLARVKAIIPESQTLVLTSLHLADAIQVSEPNLAPTNIICEPMKRNTAGCLCWLAATLLAQDLEPSSVTLAILAADHKISPLSAFHETVNAAMDLAEKDGGLVTIGIRPDRPEIGYGYIEADLMRPNLFSDTCFAYSVTRFHEKPSSDLAEEYVATEGFYWNSGMFFWRLDVFLTELAKFAPQHYSVTCELAPLIRDGDLSLASRVFATLPDISIDYLLMERSSKVSVVEATFEWDDVGSWDAVSRYMDTDIRGNTLIGDNVMVDATDCTVHNGTKGMTVCLSGVHDLLVVVTHDAVLICDKQKPPAVREMVTQLAAQGSTKL
jgi:mannose-1-phosphate guanylyltransferase